VIARISMTVFFFIIILFPALITCENVLADEAIPFTERGSLKYVTVQVNGVPLQLVFDTGSSSLVLNSAALQSLGIVVEFGATRKLQARTAGGIVDGYVLTINSVTVGSIQKSNYDVAYVPSSTENLLGSSFFSNYNYYIDEDYKVIRLIPKGSFIFDNPLQPLSPVERQSNGSGRIEVEMDGNKYIYGQGWKGGKGQEK
jgi:clan AA aspartic protease (TIGR02281 family)